MIFLKNLWKHKAVRIAIGGFLGALLGFAYYTFIGCRTGSCPITSHPVLTTVWGGVIGMLATS